MPRTIGCQSLEGRYFIVEVPDGWKETDPLPEPAATDRWFDRLTDFKAALKGPWIRKPVRRAPYRPAAPPAAPPSAPQPTQAARSVSAKPLRP